MHAGKTGQFLFEMMHRAPVGVVSVEKTKGALQQVEQFRRGMLQFRY